MNAEASLVAHDMQPHPLWKHDLKVAAVLAVASALATAALFPYLMQVLPEAMKAPLKVVPLPVLVTLQSLQAGIVVGLLSLFGLRMGHRVGLGAPLLQHWLNRRPLPAVAFKPMQSATLGLLSAVAVLLLAAAFAPVMPEMANPPGELAPANAAFNGFLASFYGGIVEELQLRLFLVTLVVWIVARLRRAPAPAAAYWLALVFAAVLFGVGHLPAANELWGLDGIVVSRTILLNAVAGIVFGWLYWKRGIEMAILAHFSADIVLHVVTPLLGISL